MLVFSRLLLRYGADVNTRNRRDNSAVHIALLNYNFSMLTSVLGEQPKLDVVNDEGYYPLHIAVEV